MLKNYEDILTWIKDDDIMIVDRGFRDSLGVLQALGINAAMPPFLGPNRRQLNVNDANRSRFITKLRWVVESVNARLKRFRWFSQTIQNSALQSVSDFLASVAALVNCFHVPMITASPDDDNVVHRMNTLLTQNNALHDRLIEKNLLRSGAWQTTDVGSLGEPFPELSLDYIRSLTLGNSYLRR